MKLVAKKLIGYSMPDTGKIWFNSWRLEDEAGKSYGTLICNTSWNKKYSVSINNPVHPELGNYASQQFFSQDEALTWAREQIEGLPNVTEEMIHIAISTVKDARYRDEMSDDYAYSNGKIKRWDKILQDLEAKIAEVA